jgi:hypothetical protein
MLTTDRLREANATTDVVTETGIEGAIAEGRVHLAIEAQDPLAVKAR